MIARSKWGGGGGASYEKNRRKLGLYGGLGKLNWRTICKLCDTSRGGNLAERQGCTLRHLKGKGGGKRPGSFSESRAMLDGPEKGAVLKGRGSHPGAKH